MSMNGRLHSSFRMGREFATLLLVTGTLTVVSGCGGGGSNSGGGGGSLPTITSVNVSCLPSSILITQTSTCTPTVTGTGNYSSSVTWSASPSNLGSVNSAGVFTPAAAGSATITATSTQDSTKSGNGSISAANTTALAISITDLPAGTSGAVTLTDPNGQKTQVTASEIITAIPGTYTVAAASVSAGSSTYIAKLQTQTVTVVSGSPTAVAIDYYNVIPLTTKVLDSTGMAGLQISTDGTTLTINSASAVAQSLSVGDVLVVPSTVPGGVAPQGMLRKVSAVNVGSSTIIVTVQAATLAQAFQRLAIQINNEPGAPAVQAVHALPGVVFHPGARLQPHPLAHSLSNSNAVQDPCGNFTLGVFDTTQPISLDPVSGVTLDGQVELCAGIDLSLDIVGSGFLNLQPQLNSLTASATVGEYSDLTLQGQYELGLFNYGPVTLATLDLDAIPVPGLPIWVTPEVSVFVGANGTISTGFSTEASEAGSITGGVSYSSGQWTPIQPTPSLQFSYTPPVLDASLQAKAYAGADLGLSIYDVVGPDFKPDGYLAFDADITANPWWTLTGGVEGPMSLDVGFLGYNLASYDLGNMFDYSTVIAHAAGPFSPSSSNPVIQSLSPPQVVAGSAGFSLGLSGSNFVPGAVVNFGATPLSTTWQNSGALTAVVPATLVVQAGTISVTVANPGANAGVSAPVNFIVASGVAVSPSTVSVPASSVQSFTAAVSGGGAITWSVEEGTSGGTITSSGIYTAPSQTGTYHVVATSSANTSESATASVNVVTGPSITTIHSFNHTTEGANPWNAPIWGGDGDMYGVTEAGGNLSCAYTSVLTGCGTIYKSDTSGNVTTLHSFAGIDGAYPAASLAATGGGMFYGTTQYGGTNTSECLIGATSTAAGCGTVFSYSATAGFTSLLSFGPFSSPLGVGPVASLVQTSGTLYGETEVGGNTSCTGTLGTTSASGCGSIFSVSNSNAASALHTFSGSEGAYPTVGLLLQSDGNFYGTTGGGGVLTCSSYATLGCGTVFQMTPSNAVKTLHSFTKQDGADPVSALILGTDGSMYGTTTFGGSTTCSGGAQWQGCGTVFKIDASGNFTSLHSFSGPDGAYPATLMQASDGYFYGTTEDGGDAACTGRYGPGCGTVFRMDSSGNVTVLYSFTGKSDGSWPESGVIQGTDGSLYGTAVNGGVNDDGVIFRISNLTSLTPSAIVTSDLPEIRPAIAPLLVTRPHVGPPGPPVPAHP